MPSNQLPEDVRDRFSEVLLEHSVDRYLNYRQGGGQVCECGEMLMGALPFAEHQLDAIAPLIIGWARQDQAGVVQIERAFGVQYAIDILRTVERYPHPLVEATRRLTNIKQTYLAAANAIRAQFIPETTGAPDDQQ